jgi:LTXXQ motif family protein
MIRHALLICLFAVASVLDSRPTVAQSLGQHGQYGPLAQHGQAGSPYAEFMGRTIKALQEAQVADLRAGRGMGLALAAELNNYPGPKHVLELAAQLGINDRQRKQLTDMSAAMTAETVGLGEQVISLETELDRLFASRAVTPASLDAMPQTIGQKQASLRTAHLKHHLTTRDVLTAEQSQSYDRLRGYTKPAGKP